MGEEADRRWAEILWQSQGFPSSLVAHCHSWLIWWPEWNCQWGKQCEHAGVLGLERVLLGRRAAEQPSRSFLHIPSAFCPERHLSLIPSSFTFSSAVAACTSSLKHKMQLLSVWWRQGGLMFLVRLGGWKCTALILHCRKETTELLITRTNHTAIQIFGITGYQDLFFFGGSNSPP